MLCTYYDFLHARLNKFLFGVHAPRDLAAHTFFFEQKYLCTFHSRHIFVVLILIRKLSVTPQLFFLKKIKNQQAAKSWIVHRSVF